nr:PAS domain S-box protein [uncultured Methanoregula sp.]
MTETIRVLYVDDERDLLEIGKLFLEDLGGFLVDTQSSAKDGLAALSSAGYDAVVSDYQMPGMDGIAFLKQVRGSKNSIPFILFTGRGREEVVIQALNEGADFYLQKGGEPVAQFTELSHKVRQAVQQRRAEASIRDHERRETDIINFLPDATFAIDANGIVIAWNRAMEEFSGVPAKEILGKGNYEYSLSIYNERRPVLIDLVLQDDKETETKYPYILRYGKKLISEKFLPEKNNGAGAMIWFTASPLYDTTGKTIGAIESIRDITERRRIEEDVVFKNLILTTQQETSPDAILIVDNGGKIIHYNRKFIEIWKIPEEIIAPGVDEPVLQYVTEQNADPAAFLARVRYLYDHNVEKSFEELRLKDGRILERHSAPMIGNDGKFYGRVWYFRDITDRKRAEEALVREKTFIEAIFNSIPGMVYLYDADGKLVRWNKNHELMTGYNADELSRMRLYDWYREDTESQAAVTEGIKKTIETGFGEAQARLQKKDGSTIPMYFTASPLTIGNNHYFTGIGIDITDRLKAEKELRESAERYKSLITVSNTGVWEYDRDRNHLWCSPEYFTMLGRDIKDYSQPGAATLKEVWIDLLHPDDRERATGEFMQYLESNSTGIYENHYRMQHADGHWVWIWARGRTLRDTNGTLTGKTIGTLIDVTKLKKAEEWQRIYNEHLRLAQEMGHTGSWQIRIGSDMVWGSDETFRIFGIPQPDGGMLSLEQFLFRIPERDLVRTALDDLVRNDKAFDIEYTIEPADGSGTKTVHSKARILYDADNKPAWIAGVIQDITELKRADHLIREANTLYARTQKIAHVGSWQWDLQGNRIEWSDETYRIFGYEPDGFDLTLENIRKHIHPADLEKHDRIFFQVRTTRRYDPEEYRVIRPDGTERVISSMGEVITDNSGAIVRIRGSIQDITEHKRAEAALRESERKYRTVIENIQDIFYRTDMEGRLTMISPSWATVLGYESTDDCIGKSVAEDFYYEPEKRDEFLEMIRKNGQVENYEAVLKRKNGQPVYVLTNSHIFYNKDGSFAGIEGTIRDITPLKDAELALRENEKKYRTVFENTGTATVMLESDGTISLANTEFGRLTGYAKEEIENKKKWMEFVEKEDLDRMLTQHRLRREDSANALSHYEFRLIARSGDRREIYLTIDLIPGTTKSVASLLDITERRRKEDALLKKTEELHAAYEQITATEEELRSNFDELSRQELALCDTVKKLADIIEFLPDATFAVDADGRVIAWNQAIEQLTGRPKATMLGRGNYEYSVAIYGERRPILIDLVLHKEEMVSEYYPGMKREGDKLFAEWFSPHLHEGRGAHLWFVASPLYATNGMISGAIESIREITEQKEREAALNRKNEELGAAYEEITSTEEELRQQVEEIQSTQAALKESEERYRNIIEDQTEFICRFRPDGTHIFINEAYCRYFGMSREAILGHRFRPRIPAEDRKHLAEFLASLTPSRPVGTIEHRIIMPDGTERWQSWSDRAIFDSGGTAVEFQSVGRDITRTKQVEEELHRTVKEYSDLLKNISDVYYRSDVNGNLVLASRSFALLLGYDDLSECIGKPVAATFYADPGDRARFVDQVLRNGSVTDYELVLKRKDGTTITVATSSYVYSDPDGRIRGIEGTFRDMTERKRISEHIREAEQRLTDIINFLPDATFAIDREGRVIAWNRAIEEMTGVSAGEMIGKGNYEYSLPFYSERRPTLIDLIFSGNVKTEKMYASVQRNGTILTAETGIARVAGKNIFLWEKAGPLFNTSGEVIGAIESIRDITDKRLLEDSLKQLNRKLNLLGSITRHDINNQLTKLMSYLRMLEKTQPEVSDNEYARKIAVIARQILSMIQFTRQYEEIGVKAAAWQDCRMLADNAKSEIGPSPVILKNDLPFGIEIFADPLILKVFYNLVDNAVTYGEKITTIRFFSKESGEDFILVCEDDGCGVPFDQKEQIFERGYGKNTGLGLALSKEILAITEITIAETGEPGTGARFELTVPKGAWRIRKEDPAGS